MLSKPASRSVCTAPRTSSGCAQPFERLEQVRLEALRAERDPVDAVLAQQRGEAGRHRLRVRLDRRFCRRRQAGEQACERGGLGEGRRAAAEEDGVDLAREVPALELQLGEQGIDVAAVLVVVSGHRDEVAVAAPVGAERQVHVEVAGAHFLSSRLSTARNASCGTSTPPTCFIRFLPFFCFSSSFRLRLMSPP